MSQDVVFAGIARRAIEERAALDGAAQLEVFVSKPVDTTFTREDNVAPESRATPVWSTAGKASVVLSPTSISVRFVPEDDSAFAKRPAGPARIRSLDGSWEAVKGYGGLPQTAGEVLFDGALLLHRSGKGAIAVTRIVFAGAAWKAGVEIAGKDARRTRARARRCQPS